jgi:hypothetical protein
MPGIDSFTKLCLHMDTDFSDSSSNNYTPTLINTPTIDGTNKVFGAGAGNFVLASSQAVTYPDSADWAFGTGDFTIDFRIRFNSLGTTAIIVAEQFLDANNYWTLYLLTSNGSWHFECFGATISLANYVYVQGPSLSTYYHIALVRNGATIFLFIDGVSQSLTVNTAITTNSIPDLATPLNICRRNDNTFFMNGQIDEFRISKGIARWTSNFTPPTAAYNTSVGGVLTPRSKFWGDI